MRAYIVIFNASDSGETVQDYAVYLKSDEAWRAVASRAGEIRTALLNEGFVQTVERRGTDKEGRNFVNIQMSGNDESRVYVWLLTEAELNKPKCMSDEDWLLFRNGVGTN